ncbi:zf-TFIIB domain-containing protein [Halorientalis salina]|nr:zf-TFIIB domain-containing protein [Halorientalis salina]
MTTEFDLPCADCGQDLVRRQVLRAGESVTVAQCPNCGGQYYPKAALERL